MKKILKAAVSCLLTLCILLMPFSGVLVFAQSATAPTVTFSIDALDYVTPDMAITVAFAAQGDATLTACDTRLEGVSLGTAESVTFTPQEQNLTNGVYTIVAEATDSNGEKTVEAIPFYVVDEIEMNFYYNENEEIVPGVEGAVGAYHAVTPLDYTMGYGSTANGVISLEDTLLYDVQTGINMQYYTVPVDHASTAGIPYQTFDIALNGKTDGEVVVRYTGSTYTGERIAVKVYNPSTAAWDTVGTFTGSGSVSAPVDVTTYADNDAIHVAAILDYVTNGANTMIWSTDPQHYTKFEDLYEFYYKVYQYAADEYVAGNVGYIITTGDLVDDRPNTASAVKQWEVADQAMSYVEAVGMPNGLETGNHDVGDFKKPDYSETASTADYSKFWETFPASRYNTEAWYGGSLNNNASHYDLITIGNVDFVILYLGYGVEATDETIAWANDVLTRYSHRTAIVATHQYLDAATADRAPASRAQLIHDTIVDPNPNVKMVICGHDDGSIVNEVTASDGRTVYELLSDYQFVEAEDPDFYQNEHYIGSVPSCCGDGYIRLLTVEGDYLSSITYSPVTGRYNPYGDRENIKLDLNTGVPSRYLSTISFSSYVLGEEITVEETRNTPNAIVITKDDATTYHHVSYSSYPEYTDAGTNVAVDLAALEALIAKAEALDLTPYTEQSVQALGFTLEDVKAIDTTDSSEVSTAYFLLTCTLGYMQEIKEIIDPATLQSIYNYDMMPSKWTTTDTVKTALDGTGFKLSRNTTNGWASVNSSEKYSIKANNGKIYVQLDVDADCAWSIHLAAAQANVSASIVINHAVDNAFNRTNCDSMNGVYSGVYDITKAFTAVGMDPSATIEISKTYLYIVPGDGSPQYTDLATNPDTVDYRYVELMTDVAATDEVDTSELQALIDSCAELDETLYTIGSWKKLQSALTVANAALENTEYLQADINLEVINLQNAINKLKLLTDVIPEPEGSLLPADEGNWIEYEANTSDVYRDENNYTVIQNTNNKWPSLSYTFPQALTYTVADHQLAVDMTVAGNSRVDLLVAGTWVNIGTYITGGKMNGEDMLGGTFTIDIPLSEIFTTESVTITAIRVYAIGSSSASAVTLRQMQIVDYVAPPHVEEVCLDLMPETDEEWTLVSGDGTVTVENGVLTAVNNGDGDLRITLNNHDYFNLEKLNSLHMEFESEIPFKMAYNIVNSNNSSNGNWPNTSDLFSHIFEITNDRAAAGKYDVQLEMRDNCPSITDKSSVYFNQFIILLTGKGTFTLNVAEMVPYDNFEWDETLTTYGPAATPTYPFYAHAAQKAPEVEYKFDILEAINYPAHPTVTGWTAIGNQASNQLGLEIDISKTPYLYYSFAVPEGGNFTFALYGNSNYCPWLSFLDSSGDAPFINQGAANWDSYTNREQYMTTSQTACIDMRPLLKNPAVLKWIITQINFYNSTGKGVIISYFFFGSEPIAVEPDPDTCEHNVVHMDAVEPGCHYTGNIEHWYCTECETVWQDEAMTQITNHLNVIVPALGGEVVHVDAVDATCYENGNVEYWYCETCEQVWQDEALTQLTNRLNVIVPAAHTDLVHFDAIEPTCHYSGNIEYWMCYDCETVWQDEALTQITNTKNVVVPALGSENLQHVEAVEPTVTENGNLEYWYCPDCEGYWLDEACTLVTNRLSVILPATGELGLNAAARMFYILNGVIEPTEQDQELMDVNGDGRFTLYDVARMFYFINGIIEKL